MSKKNPGSRSPRPGPSAKPATPAMALPPAWGQIPFRTDVQGRKVAKVPRADLILYLRRKAWMGEFVAGGVSAPATTPFDNARVLVIENIAQQGVLFDVAEGVDGLIAEIYEASDQRYSQ